MPQQVLTVFFAIAVLISPNAFAASGTSNFRSSDDWRSYYQNQGTGVADLQGVTQNAGLGIQARVGACRAGNGTWTGSGCSFPQPEQQQQTVADLTDPRDQGDGVPVHAAQGDPNLGLSHDLSGDYRPPAAAASTAGMGYGADGCTGVPCFQNQYKASNPSDYQLSVDMNNPNLPAAQRYSACLGLGDPRGCDSLKTAASESGAYMGENGGGGTTPAPATGQVSVKKGSLEELCPYTNTGSPVASQTAEGTEGSNCSATKSTTETACLTPGTGGMNAGEAAMFTMMMNQMVGLAGQMASAGKNMAQQCRLQADISTAMTAINGIKGAACGVMIGQCTKRCGMSSEQFTAAAEALEAQAAAAGTAGAALAADAKKCHTAAGKAKAVAGQCNAYSGQVMAMMMGAMQHGAGIVQNKQCAAEASAFANQPMPTFSPIALPNPTDCSDPNNQSLTCFCSRESNAKSPMCAGFNPGAVAGGGASPSGPGNGIGSSAATPFLGTDDGSETDGNTVDPFAAKQNASNGGDGFSAGGGSPPGGSLGSLGGDEGGGGGAGDPRSAITGTSGGQGNGLGSSGGGGGGGLARNNRSAGGLGGFMDKFNLKKFLPGSKYKARGIAGMSVKSVDGITGPMGPSIWEKASRQYQEQIQKQNVILDNK